MLALLRGRGLLSEERIELLLSWRRSGFSVHNRVYAHPGEGRDFEVLVRYMMRSPVSLTKLRFTPGAKEVLYARRGGHDGSEPGEGERFDAEEFVARALIQIPDPRRHLVCYYGAYSNRGCPRCGAEMRVIGFLTDLTVVRRIVDHLRRRDRPARPPPPRILQTAVRPA